MPKQLFNGYGIVVLNETHLNIRVKCPNNCLMVMVSLF